MATRVEVESVKTQRLTTRHLLKERLAALLQTLQLGVSEVYQIAVVW